MALSGHRKEIRVLLADNDAERIKATAETVRWAFDITVVDEENDVDGVLRGVMAHTPDVVVLDWHILGHPAAPATRRIGEAAPGSAVLLVSDVRREDLLLESLGAGAAGYAVRSSRPDELLAAIRSVADGQVYVSPCMAAQLVASYLNRVGSLQDSDAYERFTTREREVLRLLAEGHTHKEIAELLRVSPYAVQTIRQRIMKRLGLRNGTQILSYALRKGLISLEK